jgi:hypothetical protein
VVLKNKGGFKSFSVSYGLAISPLRDLITTSIKGGNNYIARYYGMF